MNNDDQAALDAVMNFLDRYAEKNIEGCMAAFAASTPLLLLGTNEDEVFKTTAAIRGAFAKDFTYSFT